MVAGVGDHGVTRPQDRAERPDVRLMAGGEHQRRLAAEPFGQLAFELQVQIGRAVQEARARQPGPVAAQCVECAAVHPLVAGQAQVVVGPEHDPLTALHLHDRKRGPLQHAEVGHQVELASRAQLLEPVVLTGLCEDVDGGPHRLTVSRECSSDDRDPR